MNEKLHYNGDIAQNLKDEVDYFIKEAKNPGPVIEKLGGVLGVIKSSKKEKHAAVRERLAELYPKGEEIAQKLQIILDDVKEGASVVPEFERIMKKLKRHLKKNKKKVDNLIEKYLNKKDEMAKQFLLAVDQVVSVAEELIESNTKEFDSKI